MGEFFGSIVEYFKARMKTPVYGIFGFWWIVLHWEFFYTLIFVNEKDILQHTGYLKNEYLRMHFNNYLDPAYWLWVVVTFILCIVLTILMVWVIPRTFLHWAYIRQQKDVFEKSKVKFEYERNIQQERLKLAAQEERTLVAEEKKVKQAKIVNDADPTIEWDSEYKNFKRLALFSSFTDIIESIYEYEGNINKGNDFYIEQEILIYAHANELIEFTSANRITLTKKGLYFVKLFSADKNAPKLSIDVK